MPGDRQSYRSLTLDVDRYQAMLDSLDLSDPEKKEMAEVLWLWVISFVDLDFELHLQDSCGQLGNGGPIAADGSSSMLGSGNCNARSEFAQAANSTDEPKQQKEAP